MLLEIFIFLEKLYIFNKYIHGYFIIFLSFLFFFIITDYVVRCKFKLFWFITYFVLQILFIYIGFIILFEWRFVEYHPRWDILKLPDFVALFRDMALLIKLKPFKFTILFLHFFIIVPIYVIVFFTKLSLSKAEYEEDRLESEVSFSNLDIFRVKDFASIHASLFYFMCWNVFVQNGLLWAIDYKGWPPVIAALFIVYLIYLHSPKAWEKRQKLFLEESHTRVSCMVPTFIFIASRHEATRKSWEESLLPKDFFVGKEKDKNSSS